MRSASDLSLAIVLLLSIAGQSIGLSHFANPNLLFTGSGFALKDPNFNDCTPMEEPLNGGQIPRMIVGETTQYLTCEPIGEPGQVINISYNKSRIKEIVKFRDWRAELRMEFSCGDPDNRDSKAFSTSTNLGEDGSEIITQAITLPGELPTDASSNNSGCLDIVPYGTLSLRVDSFDNDYSTLLFTIPFNLNISERLLPANQTVPGGIGVDSIGALMISSVAFTFIMFWSLLLHHAHRNREARAAMAMHKAARSKEAVKQFNADRLSRTYSHNTAMTITGPFHSQNTSTKIAGAEFRPLEFTLDDLDALKTFSNGIDAHISEGDPQLLCKATEDPDPGQAVHSTTSSTRISNLGKTRLVVYQMLASQLVSIGSATMVVTRDGNLVKLPRAFDYLSTLWISLAFLTIVFALSVFVANLLFAGTIDQNFGLFWWIGGIGLYSTIAFMQGTIKRPAKGMLRLFRSIAPPTCEEFMFSYAWDDTSRPEDIRTLARAMFEIGLHVWVDTVKLVSGCMITTTLASAVRTANTVVIFLTPAFLSRYNTATELLEALHYPGKIHIHVVKWDKNVYGILDLIVRTFHVPKERITAHKMKEERDFDLSSPIQEINDALLNGGGWYDLGAMLDAYSKGKRNNNLSSCGIQNFADNNDIFDFQWWIKYASNHGGIPQTAPYPDGIKPWNFWGVIGSAEICSPKDVRVGNVWLRADGKYVGTRGSAFPWFVVPIIMFMLFPIGDIALIALREHQIVQKAQVCADDLRTQVATGGVLKNHHGIAYEASPTLHAICRRFHRSPPFTTKFSAFKMDAVADMYDSLYESLKQNCTAGNRSLSYWLNPMLSGRVERSKADCIRELQYYFVGKDYYIPRNVQIVFNGIFLVFFTIIGMLNLPRALSYADPPPCLRPLLATSTLVSKKQAARNTHFKSFEMDGLMENGGQVATDEDDGFLPPIKVAVHGSGEIANNLETFLKLLGFLADPSFFEGGRVKRTPSRLGRSSRQSSSNGEPKNQNNETLPVKHTPSRLRPFSQLSTSNGGPSNFTDGNVTDASHSTEADSVLVHVPFVWVDVHVISSIQDRENLYGMREHLRYDQMVVAIGGSSEVTNDGPEESKTWLKSVLFIDCNDNTTDFATSVMENISLRTKDALVGFGHQAYSPQQ
ncbi:hypothetical protein BJ742DRAFT_814656 [Cladochytrium replicatum]|nr:hypothetical protein BJ742DRAFT_814656 [Cladochytrium replicatum]